MKLKPSAHRNGCSLVASMLLCFASSPSDTLAAAAQDNVDVPTAKEVSGTPVATDPARYAREIGSAIFTRSALKTQNGYTVESGMLKSSDTVGSLVVVRAPDGAVTALVDEPQRRGLLRVAPDGTSTFAEDKPYDFMTPDTLEQAQASTGGEALEKDGGVAAEPKVIDIVTAFSNGAAAQVGDPLAYSIAQIEMVNLMLHLSLVPSVRLRLVALNIYDTALLVGELDKWRDLMEPSRARYNADLTAAFAQGGGGLAYLGGHSSSNGVDGTTVFRHEVAHNVGGVHCNPGNDSYNYGYNNGRSRTSLCGNDVPYYSNPYVRDVQGLPLGDPNTANMSRVWEERAGIMSSYFPALAGERLILVGTGEQARAELRIKTSVASPAAGVVARDASVGPKTLEGLPAGGFTTLTVNLDNGKGTWLPVKFRAQRWIGGCEKGAMNRNAECQGGGALFFSIAYTAQDNESLSPGMYNGVLKLEARDNNVPFWRQHVTISISVHVP